MLGSLGAGRMLESGMRLGRLGRAWAAVVGERLAEECTPAALEDGVLVIRASSSAWATQLTFLTEEIADRANLALGTPVVREVRVAVGSMAGGRSPRRGGGRGRARRRGGFEGAGRGDPRMALPMV